MQFINSSQDNNFVYVHTPIITGSDAEGAGEMFRKLQPLIWIVYLKMIMAKLIIRVISLEKKQAFTVSGQLEAETFALAFRNVYTFGPTFRAENSNTARHASEFWMIEPEVAFADLGDNMELAEKMIKYIIEYVLEEAKEEMKFFTSLLTKDLLKDLTI